MARIARGYGIHRYIACFLFEEVQSNLSSFMKACPESSAVLLCPECDNDGDGIVNKDDFCMKDPDKKDGGACGCGNSDVDSDQNDIPDCLEGLVGNCDIKEPFCETHCLA